MNIFLELAACSLGDGSTIRLWLDNWSDDILRVKLPNLFLFARDQNISLRRAVQICNTKEIYDIFHLPLSMIASQQCDQLAAEIGLRAENNDPGRWQLANVNKPYSCKRVYDIMSPNDLAQYP